MKPITIKCGNETYIVHPAANMFPLLSRAELKELADNIKERGLAVDVTRDKDGLIMDGRNRLLACHKAGVEPRFDTYTGDDPVGFIISANIHRRNLTRNQRSFFLTKLIAMQPEKSNRQIAKETGVSDKTIGAARKEGETCGVIPHVEKHTDTKGRKQPSRKPSKKTPSLALVDAVKAKAEADKATVDAPVVKAKPGTIAPASTVALANFIYACNTWLPKLDTADRGTATTHFQKTMARFNGHAENPIEERRAAVEAEAAKAEA
jgi:hypothetical protein